MRNIFVRGLFVASLCLAVCAAGCKSKEKKTPPKKTVVEERFRVDPELSRWVGELAEKCQVDLERGSVECGDDTYRKIIREYAAGQRSVAQSLEPFLALLDKSDEKRQAVVASLLYDVTRGGLKTASQPRAVRGEEAAGFRDMLARLKPVQARQVAAVAAHTAALTGTVRELFDVARKVPSLEAAVLRAIMVEGRLDGFAEVRRAVSEGAPAVRLAALEAPRNMPRWSEQDRAAICPWALALLDDKQPLVPERAASLLVHCPETGVEALLARAERLVRADTLGAADMPPLRELCVWEYGATRTSEEHCRKNRDLLTRVVESKKAAGRVRALALGAMAYQWPDANTLKLAEKWASASEPDLAAQATTSRDLLKRRLANTGPTKRTAAPEKPLTKQ